MLQFMKINIGNQDESNCDRESSSEYNSLSLHEDWNKLGDDVKRREKRSEIK